MNRRTIIILIVLAVLCVPATWFVLRQPAFSVDPDRVKPVEIDVEPAAETPVADSAESPATTAVHKGSITDMLEEKCDDDQHPLDPALRVAQAGLDYMRENVRDYTATIVRRERVKGKLGPESFVDVKIRHEGNGEESAGAEAAQQIPFSVYTCFLKPDDLAGQEAIWIKGKNGNRLVAHGVGATRFFKVNLKPTSFLAMRGNRYPITEIGIKNLIVRMIEKGKNDLDHGECDVEYDRNYQIEGRSATLITITHPEKRKHFSYYVAKIFIDDELNVPVGFEGYTWPRDPGGEPVLIERYFYKNLQLNVGLNDADFDPDNPDYDYP